MTVWCVVVQNGLATRLDVLADRDHQKQSTDTQLLTSIAADVTSQLADGLASSTALTGGMASFTGGDLDSLTDDLESLSCNDLKSLAADMKLSVVPYTVTDQLSSCQPQRHRNSSLSNCHLCDPTSTCTMSE